MTKKLFVVLVVVSAMLISMSLVMAAKNAGLRHIPDKMVKSEFANKQHAQLLPSAPPITKKSVISEQTGHPMKSGLANKVNVRGTPLRKGAPSGKDLCNLADTPAYFITDWIYGLESYANYQDPAAHGCSDVWPFQPTEIDFQMNIHSNWVGGPVILQGFILSDVGTPSCPVPGVVPTDVICSTPVDTFNVPAGGGYFEFPLPLTEQCCVNHPYFAAVYISTNFYAMGDTVDAVTDQIPLACRSYNDMGTSTWYDLNSYGFPGTLMLYSQGYTHPQNPCPTPPADTCYVTSISPSTLTVLAGATANYTVNVAFGGTVTSCNLTVTPDPACPSCVTTLTPNPVVLPATSSAMSIQTSASTTAGTYTFAVNGSNSKSTATLIVIAPSDSCDLHRWAAGAGYRFDGWSAGDQNAVLLDPASCLSCGANVYPFQIHQVVSRWANASGATDLNVIWHIYEASAPCDGPGTEIYEFPQHITSWSPNYVSANLPDIICVHGPFWLAAEYVSVTPSTNPFPSCRMSTQTADTCVQFNKYAGSWYEWYDFWTPPAPGYYYMGVVGDCQGSGCPIECDMQEDNGSPHSYFSQWKDGDMVAKYYDPAAFCTAPVYPYRPKEASLVMYVPAAWGAKSVDVKIGIYLQAQSACDGPGTKIYESPTVTLNVPTGVSVQTVELPNTICLYRPFFVALEYQSGTAGNDPSILFDNNTIPPDTCHAWMYYGPYSPPWYEWYDFWSAPVPGRPMIRVVGTTNDPGCNPPPCDTTIETIAGGSFAHYYWKQPANDPFLNMKFEMPADHGGRLEAFEVAFYWPSAHPNWGTPDPDFYVWLSDGTYPLDNNPPYGAIASYHLNYNSLVWYPNYNYIPTYTQAIDFEAGEMFHIGFNHDATPGDTLAILSNDGSEGPVANNPSGWDGTAWESYSPYAFLIDAFICPIAPSNPSFTLKCSPTVGYATPGDPPANVFQMGLLPILGYNLPVTLSLLSVSPVANITATFSPNPATPPDTADVAITVGAGVPYGDYTLTLQAVGADNQTRVCDVTLTVQAPYDEAIVPFYHGQQRTSNFGAVGDDKATDNFMWYGTNYLFDGSFVSAVPGTPHADHMALDMYDCVHHGFVPSQHIIVTHNPWCTAPYMENYGVVAYSNFYTDESAISCEHDSLYVIGLSDVTSTDFSIKIKISYNPTSTPIPALTTGIYEDWDIGDAQNNWVGMDTLHNFIYQYDVADPATVFGILRAPVDNVPMFNMTGIRNPQYVYPNAGFCTAWGLDSLYYLMNRPGFFMPAPTDTDMSLLAVAPPYALNPGDKHIEVWFDFGRNTADGFTWEQWYHRLLRYAGFYRGDVNASDTLELPALDVSDLVYLINYLYENGPAPQPFVDQGNVDGKGPYGGPIDTVCPKNNVDVQDLVYLVNYVFKNGPAPIDYVRFIPSFWSRTSLFTNPTW